MILNDIKKSNNNTLKRKYTKTTPSKSKKSFNNISKRNFSFYNSKIHFTSLFNLLDIFIKILKTFVFIIFLSIFFLFFDYNDIDYNKIINTSLVKYENNKTFATDLMKNYNKYNFIIKPTDQFIKNKYLNIKEYEDIQLNNENELIDKSVILKKVKEHHLILSNNEIKDLNDKISLLEIELINSNIEIMDRKRSIDDILKYMDKMNFTINKIYRK